MTVSVSAFIDHTVVAMPCVCFEIDLTFCMTVDMLSQSPTVNGHCHCHQWHCFALFFKWWPDIDAAV
ncbi:hypothetical protein FRX31_029089 [Thalictrum thalictroides]|uniref:Uncharacterized protein n=1 Tax=Thalictrum thalictroides TaxID=46969 RepID=A0A7J6V9I4_THATH|nr:hypothetical protein FRX31_029089 [Thalictrum thalictroides]